jgi:hypothetical protein
MSKVKDVLDEFGKKVVDKAKKNLDKKDTGKLEKSIGYTAKESKNSIEFSIEMEAYGNFVDKGVRGVTSSAKAPNSPFKFGTGTGKGSLRTAIEGWVKRKRFQFRKPNGQFMSYKSTALLVTRSIWHKGLETTNFLTNAFEEEFKELPEEIIKAYGLDVDKFLKSSLNNNEYNV